MGGECYMKCLVTDYFEETVDKYFDKIAFVDNNREITFGSLKKDALKIATTLVNENCFKKPVMVYMDKSIDCVVSFLGIAYSGCFYSPIDTSMPESRIRKIVDTLQPAVIITHKKETESVKTWTSNIKVIAYEEVMTDVREDENTVKNITEKIADTDILYAFFTSGSTGMPKGVLVNQRNVVDYINWVIGNYGIDDKTVIANETPFYFDLSVQDIYSSVFAGAKTVIIRKKMFSAPVRVWKILEKYGVNTFLWVPSMMCLFANMDILAHVKKLSFKTIFFCGEVMPVKQLNYWRKYYPNTRFVNLYGPTECTVACTYFDVNRDFADDDILPIGKPCKNVDAMVISENGELITEPGREGELCIRGTTVGAGYFRNPEKTAQAFVQNPAHSDYPEIVYRTGDLVTYNEYHELMYVGRMDFQIKRHGYRIELGEIEAAASSIPEIEYNCCIFDQKTQDLIFIYMGNITPDSVQEVLTSKLQSYMVPTVYYQRESMLFNLNGKIDRKALAKEYSID